jgi:hypothetical protein
MQTSHNYPDTGRLSIVSATILLVYAVAPFIQLPPWDIAFQLPGFFFDLQIQFTTLLSFLVAVLAAAGTDWLIDSHPRLGNLTRASHWILPALTAWSIGVPLTTIETGPQWWAVFALGGVLLVLVLLAEYIVVDPLDVRSGPASAGLTAVSFALFLVLAITVHAAGLRLYLLLPVLAPAVFLVSLRTLYLESRGTWYWGWGTGIALVVAEFAAGLHYWPLSSVQFGLILLAISYGLTRLAGGILDGRSYRTVWVEPAIMTVVFTMLAIVFHA